MPVSADASSLPISEKMEDSITQQNHRAGVSMVIKSRKPQREIKPETIRALEQAFGTKLRKRSSPGQNLMGFGLLCIVLSVASALFGIYLVDPLFGSMPPGSAGSGLTASLLSFFAFLGLFGLGIACLFIGALATVVGKGRKRRNRGSK